MTLATQRPYRTLNHQSWRAQIPSQSLIRQLEARLTDLCPATSRGSSGVQQHCTSPSILGCNITHGAWLRKKYAWDNSLWYARKQDKGTNQPRTQSSLWVFPRTHQAALSAQSWKMSWLGWTCVLWGQMQFILAQLQQIAKLSWMRKALRVKL